MSIHNKYKIKYNSDTFHYFLQPAKFKLKISYV